MQDVMVDIETTGTSPDRHAMIQVAAVRFNLETGEVDGANMFNQCLSIPPWRGWDEDTRDWWSKQPVHILQGIYNRMRDPRTVMDELASWSNFTPNLRMWAKPITFDHSIVSSYFRDFAIPNPFHFRMAMDCRSYLHGLASPEEFISEKEIDFDGSAHDAIYDALFQIKWLFANKDRFGRPKLGTIIEQGVAA